MVECDNLWVPLRLNEARRALEHTLLREKPRATRSVGVQTTAEYETESGAMTTSASTQARRCCGERGGCVVGRAQCNGVDRGLDSLTKALRSEVPGWRVARSFATVLGSGAASRGGVRIW